MKLNKALFILIHILLIAFAAFVFYYESTDRIILKDIIHEDLLSEWVTVIFYFIASAIFFYLYVKRSNKTIWYLCLALLCFFVAAEEISWGQRIFNIATPKSLASVNIQNETNLHNIPQFNMKRLAYLTVLGTLLILPLSNKLLHKIRELYIKYKIPVYHISGLGTIIFAILVRITARLTSHADYYTDEIIELTISIAFLFFAATEAQKCDTSTYLSN
jgi:hypothetical protein